MRHISESTVAAKGCDLGCSILLAALALPGVHSACAETAPERAQISYKYLDYQDLQPGWDRIGVRANAVSALIPIAGNWSLGATLTRDIVSGASPAFHSSRLLGADMDERRYGREASVTRYMQRASIVLGISDSQESDYISRGYSALATISTEDRNTTFSFGLGTNRDKIDAPQIGVRHESKDTDSAMAGVTQVLTPFDIVQLNITRSEGDGYYSDPYKYRDHRPDSRNQTAVLWRWNHHVRSLDGTSQLSYRYYTDSFGIAAHTLELEYVQRLPHTWTLTPILRLYSQSAADFYVDPVNPPFPAIRPRDQLQSQDQRLSQFGALTYGLKLSKEITPEWRVDAQLERYEQRSDWYQTGSGSPGIEPFRATMMQFGVSYSF